MERILTPEQWIDAYANILYAYTLTRVNDKQLAEDIVQETFLIAWKSKESYKGGASEKNWLFAICKNKIIDHYRKKATQILNYAAIDNSAQYFDDKEHWAKEECPHNWGIDYQQTIETKEFYTILELCRKKLQEMQQLVFAMKYLEELSADEICKVLNISSSNYWVLIHRAKLQLRDCLEKNWFNIK
jgi:RNA polymerase sigma-70 factor (ECF subfamily)